MPARTSRWSSAKRSRSTCPRPQRRRRAPCPAASSTAAKSAAGTTAVPIRPAPSASLAASAPFRSVPIRAATPRPRAPAQQPTSASPRQANANANANASATDASPRAGDARPQCQRLPRNAPLSLEPRRHQRAASATCTGCRAAASGARGCAGAGCSRSGAGPGGLGRRQAIWCRCRRSEARPTPRAPIAASSRNIPSVLGSQPHTVRRADLGARACTTAPWSGRSPAAKQAVQLCSSLKQAGGDCVVQH